VKPPRFVLVPFAALLLAASSAFAQSGGPYTLTWSTIDGGGGTFSTGGAYSLGGTAGQPDAGNLAGGAYAVAGGFWLGAVCLPPTAAIMSGSTAINCNTSTMITVNLTGTPPWSLTWSDGPTTSGIMTSPYVRTVSPTSTTTYTVTVPSDASCSGTSGGSFMVTVNPDVTAPTVTPPATTTTTQTLCM
jgi:hypothetical protein